MDEKRVRECCESDGTYSGIWPVTLRTRSYEDANFEQQDERDPGISYGFQ